MLTINATGLEKYTGFQVFVAAGTLLGYGPFSDGVFVETLEDGELVLWVMLCM